MRAAIRTQCFGIVAEGMIVNGILLLYLTALGVDAASTMIYLAVYPMTGAALLLPTGSAKRWSARAASSSALSAGL